MNESPSAILRKWFERVWNAYDFLSMYQQLGIEPPQPV
jgi:hypothetical protein